MKIKHFFNRVVLQWMMAMALLLQTVMPSSATRIRDKVLEMTIPSKLQSLDPAKVSGVDDRRILSCVYEGLLAYNPLESPYKLIPNLAAEMPQVSDDKLVYTFTLKPGILFQRDLCFAHGKGRELIAEDIVYTIKRIAHVKTNAPAFRYIQGKIKGLDQWRETPDAVGVFDKPVEGLRVIDRYTIQIVLNEPSPQLCDYLAMPCFYIVAKEAVAYYGNKRHNREPFDMHPVGTGPFVLTKYSPEKDKKVVLTKSPTFRTQYFPQDSGAKTYRTMLPYAGLKLPLVHKIVLHIVPNEQSAWLLFKQKKVDMLSMEGIPSFIQPFIDPVTGNLKSNAVKAGMALYKEPNSGVICYAFNEQAFPFKDNPKLKQAMAMAFDRKRCNEIVYGNISLLPESIVPEGLPGYQENYKHLYHSYDVQEAKRFLVEAGYPNGIGLPAIVLDIEQDAFQRKIAAFFAKCMGELNITVNIMEHPKAVLQKKIQERSFMLCALALHADYPDAISLFLKVCQDDPLYSMVCSHVAKMENTPERDRLYERINEMVASFVLPVIWLPQVPRLVLYHQWLKNGRYTAFHYGIEKYMDLDSVQKEASKQRGVVELEEDTIVKKAKRTVRKLTKEAAKETKISEVSQKMAEGDEKVAEKTK